MPCRFASSGTVATSRSASRAILALNAASNFLRDLVISVLHRLRQGRTLHTLTFGPISGVHFRWRMPTTRQHPCQAAPPAPPRSRRRYPLQIKDRQQRLDRLRAAHVGRQDRRLEPDAARIGSGGLAVAYTRLADGGRTDTGHHLALPQGTGAGGARGGV